VDSIERAITIIDFLASRTLPVGLKDISGELAMNKVKRPESFGQPGTFRLGAQGLQWGLHLTILV